MNIFIVIPVFNRKAYTRDCLDSLRQQTVSNFTAIVVDDGSTDGTGKMLQEEYPEVKVLKGDGNLWWTGGVNFGLGYALEQGADYCLTLNNDTILPPQYLAKMQRWAEEKPQAVMGSLEKEHKTERLLYGGEWYDEKTTTKLLDVLDESQHHGLHPVTNLPGRGLWIPRTVFDKIGLFDIKRFPHYLADYDFTYNAYRAGFEVFMNYDAYLYSFPDASGANQNIQQKSLKGYYNHLFSFRGAGNLRNYLVFQLKNCPRPLLIPRLAEGLSRRIVGYWLK